MKNLNEKTIIIKPDPPDPLESIQSIDCLICLDYPPNKATLLIDRFLTCSSCFDCIASSLITEAIEHLEFL